MCCCCCKRGFFTCWFILSIIFSVITIAAISAISVHLGGIIIPTQLFEDGTNMLFLSNCLTVVFCIVAIIGICKDWKHLIVWGIITFFLLFITCSSIFIAHVFSSVLTHELPPVADMKVYTAEYAKNHNGNAPPVLELVQKFTGGICCGAESFTDLIITTPPTPETNQTQFNVPDSCCGTRSILASREQTKGCGTGLNYSVYNNSVWFHSKLAMFLKPAVENAKTLQDVIRNFQQNFTRELKENINSTINYLVNTNHLPHINPAASSTIPKFYIPGEVAQGKLPIYIIEHVERFVQSCIDEVVQERKPDPALRICIQTNLDNILGDLQNVELLDVLPVGVYGCGSLLHLIPEAKFVPEEIRSVVLSLLKALFIFIVFEAVLNFIDLGIYNYVYWRLIRKEGSSGDGGGLATTTSPNTGREGLESGMQNTPTYSPQPQRISYQNTSNLPSPAVVEEVEEPKVEG